MPASIRSSLVTNQSGVTTVTINAPSGVVDGDLLVVSIASGTALNSAPSGWTGLQTGIAAPALYGGVYAKIASGEPSSWNWTMPSADSHYSVAVAVKDHAARSAALSALVSSNSTTTSTTTNIAPSIVAPITDMLLLCFFAHGKTNGLSLAFSTPTGMTEYVDGSFGSRGQAADYEQIAAAGATGSRSSTVSGNPTARGWAVSLLVPPSRGGSMFGEHF